MCHTLPRVTLFHVVSRRALLADERKQAHAADADDADEWGALAATLCVPSAEEVLQKHAT